MTQFSQQDPTIAPAVISFDINSPNFLGGANFHSLLILVMLSLLIVKGR